MSGPTWPEPIACGGGDEAAALLRRLWSGAERVDAVIADPDWLAALVGEPNGAPDPNRGDRVIEPVMPGPEFILFYAAESSFPESAAMFTGGGGRAWVTFHRRPLVLERLRERFQRLLAAQRDQTPAASVREQPANSRLETAPSPGPTFAEPTLVPPDDLYRRVLAVHFSALPSGEVAPRPGSAPMLAAHQERAYERARDILHRYGGVVIADAVGLGKTYVGLRLLEHTLESGGRAIAVVPAALGDQWRRELAYLTGYGPPPPDRARRVTPPAHADNLDLWAVQETRSRPVPLLSLESLGRRDFDPGPYCGADLVLVDEAHNFRNPATRRYRALAEIVRHSSVALLTATPVNNSVLDLQHLIDLFAAPGAFRELGIPDYREAFRRAALGEGDVQAIVSACVLRRTRRFLRSHYGRIAVRDPQTNREIELRFPRRAPPLAVRYDLAGTYGQLFAGLQDWLEALRVPSVDTSDDEMSGRTESFAALLKMILLKRLESSVEAFRCTVIQQLAWCDTALRAIRAGRVLTRPDYRASFQGPADDPGSQLALFELMLPAPSVQPQRLDALRRELEHDLQIFARLHTALSSAGPSADQKLQHLVQLLDGPLAGRKVLLFTEFRDTARYLYHQLKQRPHLAQIDSDRARLGPEPASRRDIIERFAPLSNGLPEPPQRERVDLLIATDVLAEGLNLQDASIVVSYDLPWNPVRLIQRIGRIDRLGARTDRVRLYHFVPARDLDRLLGLMSRLQRKVGAIDSTLGLDHPVLGSPADHKRAIEQIRTLARGPEGYDRVEKELEGPLDPEEQAYLDYVDSPRPAAADPTGCPTAAVSSDGAQGRGRAVAYWQVNHGNQRRGLWLICDLDNSCVVENQAAALDILREARNFREAGEPKESRAPREALTRARQACRRYVRALLSRLEAARIASDSLSPGLPQCRIAAWLSRRFRDTAPRLTREECERIDSLLDRLARRFTLAAERALARLADELPERIEPQFLERLENLLLTFQSQTPGPGEVHEVATLVLLPRSDPSTALLGAARQTALPPTARPRHHPSAPRTDRPPSPRD